MKRIGVRELRQNASRYLREVERGRSIEVTDRGRPVAHLVPVPAESGLDALVANGRLTLATGDLLELGAPLESVVDAPLPSEALGALRADER